MWTRPVNYFIRYFHYVVGVIFLKWGTNGSISSQWHFLMAYDCSSKSGKSLKNKSAKYLLDAEVMERERDLSLQDFYSVSRAITIRYERAMVKYKGDERKLNVPLFLTYPE